MKIRGIKTNYALNVFRVFTTAVISIVTMPYVNNTLGPENVGKVEYVNTIINYFLLFSGLGIPIYGIREISKIRDNIKLRNKLVVELLLILFITTLVSYLFLFGVLFQLDFFYDYRELLLIMSSMVILTNIGAEWYFQGVEDQLFITIRFLIVRIFALFLLFYLVNTKADYLLYAFVLVITLGGANVFNLVYLCKTIDIKSIRIKDLDLKRHLKPIFAVFVAAISVNIYLQLDFFLIGSIAGPKFVGFYSVANKLIRFAIVFITVIGAVLLPRLTYLFQNNKDEYYQYLKKSFNYILLISIPCSICFYVFAENIIELFAGTGFEPSVLTMQILSPLCIIVGVAYFLGYLVLYPQDKEIIYTKAVLVSAVFSLIVNYFIISKYFQNGAAVVAVISELLAIFIMYFLAKKDLISLRLIDTNSIKIIFVSIITLVASLFLQSKLESGNLFLFLFYSSTIFFFFYLFLMVLGENNVNEIYEQLRRIFSNLFNRIKDFFLIT
jgi:O-antigen/teichoic acid export membrane protein